MVSLDLSKINAKLKAWAESPRGKQALNDRVAEIAAGNGKTVSGGKPVSPEDLKACAIRFIQILNKNLPDEINRPEYTNNPVGKTLHYGAVRQLPSGEYCITVSFDPDALARNSLYALSGGEDDDDGGRRGYEGVYNIVALFDKGYNASKYVYGTWAGHKNQPGGGSSAGGEGVRVRSRKNRPPLGFIQKSINEFIDTFGREYGVVVVPGSDYL